MIPEREDARQIGEAGRASLDAEHLERALAALKARPSGIFVDVDGTLSPIVSIPEEAQVLPASRRALRDLASLTDLVVIVSGRRVVDARRMVGLDDVVYFGNHGLEKWDRAEGYQSRAGQYRTRVLRALAMLERRLASLPGVRLENKDTVVSIHYRLAADPAEARREILRMAAQIADESALTVTEGKKVVELRPPLSIDKGTTLETAVRENRLRGVLCLGDDLTDVSAFRALRRLREQGDIEGLAIGVGGKETPAELSAAADALLDGPREVATFLQQLAQTLERR